MWGNHYRAGTIVEAGKGMTLEEMDMVEVLVDDGRPKTQTHVDVKYTVGSETFSTRVKNGTTIAQFGEALSYSHQGKQILGIAFEGVEIDQTDAVDDWLRRSCAVRDPFFTKRHYLLAWSFRSSGSRKYLVKIRRFLPFKVLR
jgi:hypothetical protein